MEIRRTSGARWSGSVEEGSGVLEIGRGAASLPFSLRTRVGEDPATNPEELLGAALAGCYAMSLANELGEAAVAFDVVDSRATVHLVRGDDGFSIPVVDLVALVSGCDATPDRVAEIGRTAHEHCPVARLYDAEIRLEVTAG